MNIAGRLNSTITVKSQSGAGTAGDPTYGSGTSVSARVQYGKDRTETEIAHDVVLYTTTEIKPDDRIWLPGDSTSDDTLARRPKKVSRSRSFGDADTLWKTLL